MPRKPIRAGRSRLDIRLDAELLEAVRKRTKEKGYRSAGEYIRALASRDVGGANDADPLAHFEKVAAANQNRILGSLRKVHAVQRAMYALVDTFVKASLTYLPDPGPSGMDLARSRAKERYDRVLRDAEKASFELLDVLSAQLEREDPSARPAKPPV